MTKFSLALAWLCALWVSWRVAAQEVLVPILPYTDDPAVFTTRASGQHPAGDATQDEVVSVIPTNLLEGENVLSASLHDIGASSHDSVFGCGLAARIFQSLLITNQPADVAAEVTTPVEFRVGVSGPNPHFQWYFQGQPIADAIASTYTISSVNSNHDGNYHVVITNSFESVTSRTARLTVLPDRTPPSLVRAIAEETGNIVMLTFSEAIDSILATNIAQYALADICGHTNVTVVRVQHQGALVRLTFEPPGPLTNHAVFAGGQRDVAGNTSAPLAIGIGAWRDMLPLDAPWNWSDAGVDLGIAWRAYDYVEQTNQWWNLSDPAYYPVTRALFYYGFLPLPGPRNTAITVGYPTHYFRTRFVLPGAWGNASALRLTHVINDGVAFYLNGEEVYRFNLPNGPLTFATYALQQAFPQPNAVTTSDLFVSAFRTGTNVLAAELHQFSTSSSDGTLAFGTDLKVLAAPTWPPVEPWVALERRSNHTGLLTWPAGTRLQAAPRVAGPWSDVSPAQSPLEVSFAGSQRFYRAITLSAQCSTR